MLLQLLSFYGFNTYLCGRLNAVNTSENVLLPNNAHSQLPHWHYKMVILGFCCCKEIVRFLLFILLGHFWYVR